MKINSRLAQVTVFTALLFRLGSPAVLQAEEIKTVLSKITSIGSAANNSSARAVKAGGVEMIVMGSGTQYRVGSDGKVQSLGSVSQIALVLPGRVAKLSTLHMICMERFQGLQQGVSSKLGLEFTFEGIRLGSGSYLARNILGCADVAASVQPVKTPAATPTPTATPKR